MRKPKKLRMGWCDGGEASVETFICDCGNELMPKVVAHNGCGRRDLEIMECGRCNTKWRARHVGYVFETLEDSPLE